VLAASLDAAVRKRAGDAGAAARMYEIPAPRSHDAPGDRS